MRVGSLSDGARGIDANSKIGPKSAKRFVDAGYKFAVRYVRRATAHDYDISSGEMVTLLEAGLGVMLVQHVAPENWVPSGELGTKYGAIAADEAAKVGYLIGATLWCDLEGVAPGTPASEVIAFCNNWWDEVATVGFVPGLYVGFGVVLNATQLYRSLKFTGYWGAYNVNRDQTPIVRGWQMKQYAAKELDLIPGFTNQTMDVDVIATDARGGTPALVLP